MKITLINDCIEQNQTNSTKIASASSASYQQKVTASAIASAVLQRNNQLLQRLCSYQLILVKLIQINFQNLH
jgi:anaerobic C4-dicarboxylate transporter